MKKFINLLFIAFLGTIVITSCNKTDDYDYDAEVEKAKQAELKIDSLLTDQVTKIREYKNSNLPDALEDTVVFMYNYIDKKPKRGIWYKLDTQNSENTFEYTGQYRSDAYGRQYFAVNLPKVRLKYAVKSLEGVVYKTDDGSNYDLNTISNTIFNNAWYFSFVPYSIQYNGQPHYSRGLTANGLKKGNKITVVTPSIWAFGSNKVGEIPADTPLVYEFEVLDISY